MKYIRNFNDHSIYNNVINNDYLNINKKVVSYCKNEYHIHFDQYDPYNGHEYIEIGGVKWATMNVGATSSTEQGYFFSWGNVSGHCLNGVGDYNFGTATSGEPYASSAGAALTGNIPVGTSYDMARANLGGAWRLPTKEEFQELYDNSNTEWTTVNSVAGRLFTSKTNGNSIFFPAAGYYYGSSHVNVGSIGLYWSSSFISAVNAYYLGFNSSDVSPQYYDIRFSGCPVRGVVDE